MDRTRASTGALSIEALLDEENKEVLAAMGNKRSRSANPPKAGRGITPPPPIRSMLDVNGPAPRHGSIAGIGVGITSPRDQRRPSTRLNPVDPSTWTKPHNPPSPSPESTVPAAATSPQHQGLPRIQVEDDNGFEHKYNFDIASMPTTSGGALKNPAVKKDKKNLFSDVDSAEVDSRRWSSVEHHGHATSSPKLSRSKSPAAPIGSPTGISPTKRRTSNKSSSLSDLSDVPSELADRPGLDDEEAVAESSDENDRNSSSDGESPEAERGRGRGDQGASSDKGSEARPPQSRGVRSLLDPIPSTSPGNNATNNNHAQTGFGRSGPTLSDFEDDPLEADILKAKNLGLSISPVDDSIKDRHVRMIIRGEWARFQGGTEINNNNNHTSRLYLVCSDLSTEASYALEWTVGTMLRDGDTLLAMYAIEDESAPKEPEGNREVMEESARAAHDASETMAALTRQTTNLSVGDRSASKFIPVTEASSLTGSLIASNVGKREMERLKAMDEVTQNFLKLVRKTSLQVRCMVEVIHCKSPKHLILNAIDELDPTLCVVGTRGRSSLKGVLLGSFSNYLVTKSSVPVMVARKRLKKPRHAKVNSASIRLSNNLTNSLLPRQRKSLDQARID